MDRSVNKYKPLLFVIVLSSIASCAPVVRDYYQPQYTNGELYSEGCSGSGPADTLRIQLTDDSKFTIRASSNESQDLNNFYLMFRYYLPEGVELDLLENHVVILSDGMEVGQLIIDNLLTANWTKEGKLEYDKISPTDKINGETFQRTTLFGKQDIYRSFSVSLSGKLPEHYLSFSIVLPKMLINGVRVDIEPISFKSIQKLGVDTLNC